MNSTNRQLAEMLANMTRTVSIAGVKLQQWPDPVGQDLLRCKSLPVLVELLERVLAISLVRPLGAGASSVVLDAGEGRALRLGIGDLAEIPALEEVIQPLARIRLNGLRAEVMPLAETAGISDADVANMARVLVSKGYEFTDPGADNLGRIGGRLVVIDPGAVRRMTKVLVPE